MIRSILFLQFSQILGRGLYILFSFWYINQVFGVAGKGTWGGLFALMGILAAFSNLGFEVWLTRAVASNAISRGQAISFLFRAKSGLWLVCLVAGAYWVHVDQFPVLMACAFGLAMVFDGVGLAEQAVFEGQSRVGDIALMSFLKSGGFVLVALPVAFFMEPANLAVYAWIYALALLVRTLYGWRSWRLLPEGAAPIPARAWREFVIMGSFTFVTIVYFKVDVLMLSFMAGRTAAGDYDNAYNFVEGALFISAAAGTMLYPRLIQARGEERAQLFDAVFKVVLALGCCGTAALWALGELFGTLVIGRLFDGAVAPLAILASALPVMFVNGLLNRWLFTHHRELFALICAAGVAVFNVIGNYLVIPVQGAAGAALITLLTEALLLALWLAWGRRCGRLLLWCLAAFALLGLVGFAHFEMAQGRLAVFAGLALFCAMLVWRLRRLNQLTGQQNPTPGT